MRARGVAARSEGVPAERILLLTFTRRAAREMVERARSAGRAGARRDAGRVVGGTFHSVAHRMVRLHASSLGLDPGFGVLDAGDAADLLDFVRQEQGHAASRRRFPRAQTMLDIYSRTVNAQLPLAEVLAESFPWCEEHRDALAEIFRAYGARKRALGVLDLDDLLLYWRALAPTRSIGPRIAGGFDHVLVDEYQDVNGLQVDIVRGLRAGRPGLTVVGDDFQAIYGFRAASARHILDFPTQFPDAHTVDARAQLPLDCADPRGRQRRLRAGPARASRRRCGASARAARRPELVFPRDEGEQAGEVCERVLAAREEGMELRAQAVLFRTGHDSDLLELELTRRGDPVRQVRRPALPGRRPRQGLHRAAAPGGQPGRRGELVSRAAAARRRRARRARGACSTRCAPARTARRSSAAGQRPRARPRGRARARAR